MLQSGSDATTLDTLATVGRFLSGCLLLLAAGCHKPPQQGVPFETMWSVYNHCQSSEDLLELLHDAALLTRYVEGSAVAGPTFEPLRKFVSPPVTRLSANPVDMAQACTLRAADAALAARWNNVAIELYRSMIPSKTTAHSNNYYVRRAEAALAKALNRGDASASEP